MQAASTGTPTKRESKRFQLLYELGCIASRKDGRRQEATIHHILDGGRRMGHEETIPLSPWHHQGECWEGYTPEEMARICGPSMARDKPGFEAVYGTEMELLQETNDLLRRRFGWE